MKRDAERILGLREVRNALYHSEKYLSRPDNDPVLLTYANLILSLEEGKAVEIWISGSGVSYANVPA